MEINRYQGMEQLPVTVCPFPLNAIFILKPNSLSPSLCGRLIDVVTDRQQQQQATAAIGQTN